MKRILVSLAVCGLLSQTACVSNMNTNSALGAAADAYAAMSISNEDLKQMSIQMRAQQDAQAQVAPAGSPYVKRLNRIMAKYTSVNGIPLNYKVYMTEQVNANASADGSVRVYSGLMDLMDDDELRFVLGHEIGHVALEHSMEKMRMAYGSSAVRKAASAAGGTVGALSASTLGDLGEKFVNAQFSQSEESEADMYSMDFLKKNGYKTAAAASALRKLEALSGGAKASAVSALFSSHPDAGKRAEVMEKMANQK